MIAIPTKRHRHEDISYLDLAEIKALLGAPDKSRWLGRRDHALLLTMIQTGVRVSELTALRLRDVNLAATAAHIRVLGKGRKLRAVTLTHETAAVLREWLSERQGQSDDPLFPTRQGGMLSRDAVAWLTAKHAVTASAGCPSLTAKQVTPHVLRHTNAMLPKANGVDIATIALWLGHENITTTQIYQHADPALKEAAIATIAPFGTKPGRYRPTARLPRSPVIMPSQRPSPRRPSPPDSA